MLSILTAISSVVLSTADLCESPIKGGVGEPDFCRFEESVRISTPYYSISTVEDTLVGVDMGGRRLVSQPSLWQSQIGLMIQVYDSVQNSSNADIEGRYCRGRLPEADGEIVCDGTANDVVERTYVVRKGRNIVVIELSATSLAADVLVNYEQMISSIAVNET